MACACQGRARFASRVGQLREDGKCTRSLPPNITGRRILLQTSCNLRAVFPILSTSYGYMQSTEIHRLSVGSPPSDSSSSSFQAVGETLRGPSNPSAMGGRSCLPGLALIRSTACRHSLNVLFDVEMTLSCLDRGSLLNSCRSRRGLLV